MGSVNVVLGELETVSERVVNMGLRGKVHYGVNGLCDEKEINEVSATNVTLHKFEVGIGSRRTKILEVGAVVELIEDNNLVFRVVSDETVGNMGCNETSSTSDQYVLRLVRSHVIHSGSTQMNISIKIQTVIKKS